MSSYRTQRVIGCAIVAAIGVGALLPELLASATGVSAAQTATVQDPPVVSAASASSSSAASPSFDSRWTVAATAWPNAVLRNTATTTTSNCTGCEAVAASFQVVTSSEVSNLDAANRAVALQESCTSCASLAVAEQWVVAATSGIAIITPPGLRALEALQARFDALVSPSSSVSEIESGLSAIEGDVLSVLSNDVEVVQFGPPASPPAAAPRAAAPLAGANAAAGSSPATALPEHGYTIYHYGQVSGPTPAS